MREEIRLAFCAFLYVALDMEVEAATQAEDLASMQYICDEQQCFSFGELGFSSIPCYRCGSRFSLRGCLDYDSPIALSFLLS